MSGHSKWSQIKYKKALTDAAKSKIYSKLANAITFAVREKGADPDTNFALRLAIQKAKDANMPQVNIDRAISRGTGADGRIANLSEVIYEGFGPGGIALLIFAITDNKNRTTQEVRSVLENNGGHLSGPGSVMWQFERKGIIRLPIGEKNPQDLELAAIDAGAEDVLSDEKDVIIYTAINDLEKVKNHLSNQGFQATVSQPIYEAKEIIKISDSETAKKIIDLLEKLEALDDVSEVATNFDIPKEIITKLNINQ